MRPRRTEGRRNCCAATPNCLRTCDAPWNGGCATGAPCTAANRRTSSPSANRPDAWPVGLHRRQRSGGHHRRRAATAPAVSPPVAHSGFEHAEVVGGGESLRAAAGPCGVAADRRTGECEAGWAADAARRDCRGEPPPHHAHDEARAASGAGGAGLGRVQLCSEPLP